MSDDSYRRRSHRTVHEHRADQLAALLTRTLRQYRDDLEVHNCTSCMTNVQIFERAARALHVEVREP